MLKFTCCATSDGVHLLKTPKALGGGSFGSVRLCTLKVSCRARRDGIILLGVGFKSDLSENQACNRGIPFD